MNSAAKLMMLSGIILLFFGGVIFIVQKYFDFSKLPGDIVIKKDSFTFYFPFTTCLILSVVITLILKFLHNIRS